MYGAMSTRAPASTPPANKVVGIAMAGAITLAVGYGLANGLTRDFIEVFIEPTTISTVIDDRPPPEEKPQTFETTVDVPVAQPLKPIDLPDFFVPKDPPLVIERKDPPPIDPGAGVAPPPRAPVKQMPKLIAGAKPDYPPSAIRAEWEGLTGLSVCVDARGRVTSQSLASSSGHDALDEAALKWIRGAKFRPGTIDGAASAMCGASVIYEWKIDRR